MKEYFSHDYNARNDKKLIRVFMKHGVAGIGIYWCVVEMLFEESGFLNIDEYERISFELRTDSDTIKSVIEDFELFKEDGIKFWSESAISRLTERMNKSAKARASVMKRWNKVQTNTNVLPTNNDSNTSKVKESKGKGKKKYVYNQFYDEQLELSEHHKGYEIFIKWIFGDNYLARPLVNILKMREQMDFNQYKLLEVAYLKLKNNKSIEQPKIQELLVELEDWVVKDTKNYKRTLAGMIRTFMKGNTKKIKTW